jgi:hypothetical protein
MSDESWMDGKLDESLTIEEKQQPLDIKVHFLNRESSIKHIIKTIDHHLDSDNSDSFLRKPILIYTSTRSQAKKLYDELRKSKLRDSVKKIALVADE